MEKAIYYSKNIVISDIVFHYTDKKSFYKALCEMFNNVTVREILGEPNSKIYHTLKWLDYDLLLLSQIKYLYIINRIGKVICFTNDNYVNVKNTNVNTEVNYGNGIYPLVNEDTNAFLHVDALLLETKNNRFCGDVTLGLGLGLGFTFGIFLGFFVLDFVQSRN